MALRVLFARLRFVLVFGLMFLVIGNWERLRSTWERLTTSARIEETISSNIEYFCPMDPGVLSDWPDKCPVCNMTLVRRSKAEMSPLPDGTVARMQFSPSRLWLGGVQTATASYAPLVRAIELPGTVTEGAGDRREVRAEAFARDQTWLSAAQRAVVRPIDEAHGDRSWHATVRAIVAAEHPSFRTVLLDLDTAEGESPELGTKVVVEIEAPAEDLEPFRSLPSEPPSLRPGEPRRVFACMEHRDVVSLTAGRCPRDREDLMSHELAENQRVSWWCPMHPEVVSQEPGATCRACGGMPLVPRVVSYRKPGTVLSVPASAVIVDGRRSVVYVDRGGGLFEGRLVRLGPRCGGAYPVVAGLEAGDRVVAHGAFLLDAETQLNPALAGAYFGAGPQPVSAGPASAGTPEKVDTGLRGLPAGDRALAEIQKTCPVTGKPLGSMGVPQRVEVDGRTVFVCCEGCTSALQAEPARYLSRLPVPPSEPRR
jgi:hypothetical protein